MDFISYPPTTGSPVLSQKFVYWPYPPWWVGPVRQTCKARTLSEALAMKSGQVRVEIGLARPRAEVTIDLSSRGLRSVRKGAYLSRISYLPSIKSKLALQAESIPERWVQYFSEIDPGVLDIRTQAALIQGPMGKITFDALRLTKSGSIQFVEVKGSERNVGNARYREKLEWAREVCEELGFEFVLAITDGLVGQNVLAHNVRQLIGHRFVELPARALAICNLLLATGRTTIGDLFQKLGGDNHARAQILALIGRGHIYCDFTRKLTSGTIVLRVGGEHG